VEDGVLVNPTMPCCGGCCSSGAFEPEASLVELNLVEAQENSLRLAVRLPRCAFYPAPVRRKGEIQLWVTTFGGPDCDIVGPKKDIISCSCGKQVVHEVHELLPDTRYTVEVSLVDDAMPLRSDSSKIEVRTAAAQRCQFEPEDWGHTYLKKLGEDGPQLEKTDLSVSSRMTSARSDVERRGRIHGAGPSMAPQQPAVPRSVSGADDSTIAPSDVDGADLQERNEEWDFTTEEVCRERVVEEEPQVEEIMPTARGIQCNLCSFIDCFKSMRQPPPAESGEMLFEAEVAAEMVPLPGLTPNATAPPRPRRQRPPFPGVAVDPASVGLELLPVLNESQLQHVFETRTRATRTNADT